jgi:hypothetical protein
VNLRTAAYRHLDVRKESGDELDIICPVHEDSNPSARVNVSKGVWYCHTCHASGKLEDLLKSIVGGGVIISNEVDIDRLTKPDLDDEPTYYRESWLDQFTGDIDYWAERGLKLSTIKRFRLGTDIETGYPVYPIRDEYGRVLGVTMRRTEKWARPKYLYPSGVKVHDELFGLYEARQEARSSEVFLTEGAIDAMALWDVGATAMAIYSSRISDEQVAKLRRFGPSVVTLAFDDDEAGDKAIWGWESKRGGLIPGAVHALRGFVVQRVDWSLLRGPQRPQRRSQQLDPASISRRKRRELISSPLPIWE